MPRADARNHNSCLQGYLGQVSADKERQMRTRSLLVSAIRRGHLALQSRCLPQSLRNAVPAGEKTVPQLPGFS